VARVFANAGAQKLASDLVTRFDLGAFATAFWIMRTAAPAANRTVLGADDQGGDSGWRIEMTSTGLIVGQYNYATANKTRNSSTVTALNGWTHVIVNHSNLGLNSTDFTFYINGIAEAGANVATGSGAHVAQAVAFIMGAGLGVGPNTSAPMNLGPVAVWSRTLTDAEALALAGGAHPMRFREGLVDYWALETAHGEEGWISNTYLIQGATNPTSAFGNPAIEQIPLSILEAQQGIRPRQRTRARYNVAAAAGVVLNDHNFRRVMRGAGMGVMRGAA
jgi:hypothetical protein